MADILGASAVASSSASLFSACLCIACMVER